MHSMKYSFSPIWFKNCEVIGASFQILQSLLKITEYSLNDCLLAVISYSFVKTKTLF